MHKAKKIAFRTAIALGSLVLLLSIVIQMPWVQLAITNTTASYFAEKYNFTVNIESVKLKPLAGNLQFNGITCSNQEVKLSLNEFSLSGIDLLFNKGWIREATLIDLSIEAQSFDSFNQIAAPATPGEIADVFLDKLSISNLSWNIGDSIAGSAEHVLIDSLLLTTDGTISIGNIELHRALSVAPAFESDYCEMSVEYAVEVGLALKIDTLVAEHLSLEGVLSLSNKLELSTNLYFIAEPNELTDLIEYDIGKVQGHIGYSDGRYHTAHLESSIGVKIYSAGFDDDFDNWQVYGHSNLYDYDIEIDSEGGANSSTGSINISGIGEATYSLAFNDSTYSVSIASALLSTQWGDVSNVSTDIIGYFKNNESIISLDSDECSVHTTINNDAINGAAISSKGHAVINSTDLLERWANIPATIKSGSTIDWDISPYNSAIVLWSEAIEYGLLSFNELNFEVSGSLDRYNASISCDEFIVESTGDKESLATNLTMTITKKELLIVNSSWESAKGLDGNLKLEGEVGDSTTLSFSLVTEAIDSVTTNRWVGIPFATDSILLSGTIGGHYTNPIINIHSRSENVILLGELISEISLDILYENGIARIASEVSGLGELNAGVITILGEVNGENLDLIGAIQDLPLEYVNPLLQENTAVLGGKLRGVVSISGTVTEPLITGDGEFMNATVGIDYLGTDYTVSGGFHIEPDGIELNGLDVRDTKGGSGYLVGTALHENYKDWNLDVSLFIENNPIEIMNIPYAPNRYFYGTGYGIGDVNVFGYDGQIVIEANLTTTEGTEFVLPLDVVSDADWSSFVNIVNPDAATAPSTAASAIEVTLNLNIDVSEESKARIVFDEELGDEITGRCSGNLQIDLHDLKRLEMYGDLEILEGEYLFTLGSVINKKFTAVPGGRISWFGDPYNADINIVTQYITRASLKPVLPELMSSTKQRIELDLILSGDLMRPEILFDIHAPEGNTQEKAALSSLISNDEERNRQAISLLVIHQFLPGAWQTAAIGSTGLQENSSELITSQLAYWLSGLSDDVSIGIDYDSANDTGDEAAIAVALSTQLLNDRLHIEGEVGTQNLYTGTVEDLQLQDIRIKYDLVEDGTFQLTGYSTQRATIPGLEGQSVQGVGILFNKDFDRIKDLFRRNTKNK
jgi:hypothetical protein